MNAFGVKRHLAVWVTLATLMTSHASASALSISMRHDGTNTLHFLGSKPFSLVEMKEALVRIAALDRDQAVWVRCAVGDRAADLLPLLQTIRASGLTRVHMSFPATRKGRSGLQYIALRIDPSPTNTPACTETIPLDDGFLPDPEELLAIQPAPSAGGGVTNGLHRQGTEVR